MKSKYNNKSNIINVQENKNEEVDMEYYNNTKNCVTDLQNLSLNFFPSINTYNCIPKLNSINVITFHPCISSKDYFNNTYSFKPLFTHHFFSDNEQVIGFDSLKIDFYYTCDNYEVFMKLKGCICDQYENSNHIMLMLLQNLYITTPYPGGFIETEDEFLSILNRNDQNANAENDKIKKKMKEQFQNGFYKPPGFIIYEKKISDDIFLQIRKCGFSSMYFKKENNQIIKDEEETKLTSSINFQNGNNCQSNSINKSVDTNKNYPKCNRNNSSKVVRNNSRTNASNNENINNKMYNIGNTKISNANKKKEDDCANKLHIDKNSSNKNCKNDKINNNVDDNIDDNIGSNISGNNISSNNNNDNITGNDSDILNGKSKANDKQNNNVTKLHAGSNIQFNGVSSTPNKDRKKNEKIKKEATIIKEVDDGDNKFVENKKLKKNSIRYITERDMSKLYREYLFLLKEKKKKDELPLVTECIPNTINDTECKNNNINGVYPESYVLDNEVEEQITNYVNRDYHIKYDYSIKDNFKLLHRTVEWFYHWFIESASNIEYDYRWSVILPYIVFKHDKKKKICENNFIEKLNDNIFNNSKPTLYLNNGIKKENIDESSKVSKGEIVSRGKKDTVKEREQKRKIKEEERKREEVIKRECKKDNKKEDTRQNRKRSSVVDCEENKSSPQMKKVKRGVSMKNEVEINEKNQEEKVKKGNNKNFNNKNSINNNSNIKNNNSNSNNINNGANSSSNNGCLEKQVNEVNEFIITNDVVKKAIENTLNNRENKKEEDYYAFHNDHDIVYLYSDLVSKNDKEEKDKKRKKREAVIQNTEEDFIYYFYLFGLATNYTFFTFQFDRNRISQFLIFPPMQNKGFGMMVLEKIYHLSIVNSNIKEITVEDPAVSFTQLRDIITIKICIDLKILSPSILYPDEYLKCLNIKKENFNIDKKKLMLVCKETHKQITRMIETLLLAKVLPHPAPIYTENDEKVPSVRKKAKKNENINCINSMEHFESSDLCKDVRIQIKKRMKSDYIGNLINKNMNCMASDVFKDYVKEELYKLWKKQCKVYYRTIIKLRSLYPL